MRLFALMVLKNLAAVSAHDRQGIADAGGLALAVPHLQSGDLNARMHCASLCGWFAQDDAGAHTLVRTGAVDSLVKASRSVQVTPASQACSRCLCLLLQRGPVVQAEVVRLGGMEVLLRGQQGGHGWGDHRDGGGCYLRVCLG